MSGSKEHDVMYAIVATGGKQVRVAAGDVVQVEKLEAPVGDQVELGSVKMLATEDGLVTDAGKLAQAKVVCEVMDQGRGKKIRVFKYKRRKGYRRTMGHRQSYTQLKVKEILEAGSGAKAAAKPAPKEAPAEEAPVQEAPETAAAPASGTENTEA